MRDAIVDKGAGIVAITIQTQPEMDLFEERVRID